jgi:DNA gyrase subunit A
MNFVKFKATKIEEDDELFAVRVILRKKKNIKVVITTANSYGIVFKANEVPIIGRVTIGCKGINLREGDKVVSVDLIRAKDYDKAAILTVGSNGLGKNSPLSSFTVCKRGTKGVPFLRNDDVIGSLCVNEGETPLLNVVSKYGKVVQIESNKLRSNKEKNTKGSRIINLAEGDEIVSISKVVS